MLSSLSWTRTRAVTDGRRGRPLAPTGLFSRAVHLTYSQQTLTQCVRLATNVPGEVLEPPLRRGFFRGAPFDYLDYRSAVIGVQVRASDWLVQKYHSLDFLAYPPLPDGPSPTSVAPLVPPDDLYDPEPPAP